MRPGQRAGAAPEFLQDDAGRLLVTVRAAQKLTGRALSTIRDAVAPVACDVKTGAAYWDADELAVRLRSVPHRVNRQT